MPEMHFQVRWPDGAETICYSPSLVVQDFLSAGRTYELQDFVDRSTTALNIASDRVQAKYGLLCTRALAQRDDIAYRGTRFDGGYVTVLAFHQLGRETNR